MHPRGQGQPRCGTDLTNAQAQAADETALESQAWIEHLLAQLSGARAPEATAILADLPPVTSWLARHTMPDLDQRPRRGRGTVPDLAPEQIALLLAQARAMLTGQDEPAIEAITRVCAGLPARRRMPPPGMDPRRWRGLGPVFPNRYLRAVDADLQVSDRLRLKSMTPGAARPHGAALERAALLPQLLWPEWTARMLPPAGFHVDQFRAVMSACILVPGSALQNNAEIIVPLNPHLYKASITLAMQTLADTDPDACLRPVLIAICRLAEYLDEHGSAIDYRRRRGIAAKLTLTWSRWRDLACGAGAHPGDHVPTGRFLHAQRHLHRLLTDSDLTDPAHPLAINSAAERTRYLQFTASLTPVLRRAFHREADQFLAEHGIDEPSTWHPPLTLAEGLELPGVNLDDKALRTVKRIVIDEGQALRNAAKALGIHTEHVRLALEQLDRPERTWTRGGPEAWQRDRELARILTREYFQREYVGARRTLREIAQSVGTTRRIVTEHARRHGISLDQVPRKRPRSTRPGYVSSTAATTARPATSPVNSGRAKWP